MSKALNVVGRHEGEVVLDELDQTLQSVLHKLLGPDGLGDLRDEELPVLYILHDGGDRRNAVSECLEGGLRDLVMRILDANKDAGQYGFLERLIKLEVEVLQLLADEANGQNRDLLDNQVLIAHVGGDLLGDSLPLPLRDLDAADGCDYLSGAWGTLAAALRMIFSLSIMVFITISFSEDLLAGVSLSQRKI